MTSINETDEYITENNLKLIAVATFLIATKFEVCERCFVSNRSDMVDLYEQNLIDCWILPVVHRKYFVIEFDE